MPTANRTLGPILALTAVAVLSGTSFAGAQVQQQTGLMLSNDKPIQIESDQLEVKDAEHLAHFTGNVTVVQGDVLMKAGKMTVYYTQGAMKAQEGTEAKGASDIDKIDVTDKVYLKSKEQVATGDQGHFDMKSQVMVLTGKEVVLTDADGNVIKGCKLTVQMTTGQAKFDNCRIQMLLKPNSASAASATGAAKPADAAK